MPVDLASNTKLKTVLGELRRRFEDLYGERLVKMILYGSQARGDAGRWSDIDVLVVLRGPVCHSEEVSRTGGIVSELCLEQDVVLQCLFLDEQSASRTDLPVLRNAAVEGISV